VTGDETVGTLSTLGALKAVITFGTLETVRALAGAVLTSWRGGARGGSATQVRGHIAALAERSGLLPSRSRGGHRLGGITAGLFGSQPVSPATTTTTTSSSSSSSSSSRTRSETETGCSTFGRGLGDVGTTCLAGIASGLGLFLALLLLLSNFVEFAIGQC
jgi:hypothetical protein